MKASMNDIPPLTLADTFELTASDAKAASKNAEPLVKEHAHSFLDEAVTTMKARAVLRDSHGSGERSMEKTVAIFNAWTGNTISVEDGWRFMVALKQAREIQGFYNRDDYVDAAAYFGLLGEEESGNASRRKPGNKG